MKCLFGSHLYKLDTPASDKDYKGIYMPSLDSLLMNTYAKTYSDSTGNNHSKNTNQDTDIDIYSLPYFLELACKGETVTIDMLHGDNTVEDNNLSKIWSFLKQNRTMFYTKDMRSYVGYARKQAAKYGVKGSRMQAVETVINFLKNSFNPEQLETTKIRDVALRLPHNEYVDMVTTHDNRNGSLTFYEVCTKQFQDTLTLSSLLQSCERIYNTYGDRAKMAKLDMSVDWKAISHALRASYQVKGILKDGDFEYPLPQTQFLLDVKQGKLNFVNEVQPELENVMAEIETLCKNSKLPEQCDRKFWNNWLLEQYHTYLL